jgi:hypothetical protein
MYPFSLCFPSVAGFSSFPREASKLSVIVAQDTPLATLVSRVILQSSEFALKVSNHEVTASLRLLDWYDGNNSDVEDCLDWIEDGDESVEEDITWVKEGDDYSWEGAVIFPQNQKARDDAAVALF